jgi:CelD/BcsL family acetyltransferase involved in cellulose biosynthesis
VTQLGSDWATFYKSKRSTPTRARDRTKRRKLSEIGEVRTVSVEGAPEMTRILDTLIQQKSRFFAGMGLGNMFHRPGYLEFYRGLVTSPLASPLIHVSSLQVGEAVAAANLGLVFHGCYYHVLASFDDGELSRFGPGVAHLHDLLRYAIERGCCVFDFTIGDEQYKRDWCDSRIELYDHVAIATLRGALAASILVPKRQLQRWIKQSPILWAIVSQSRARLAALGLHRQAPAHTGSAAPRRGMP